jgi:CrcB protein
MNRYVFIALGAILGANARYLVGLWAGAYLGTSFPYGTFIVNTTGSFVLGFIIGGSTGRLQISPDLRLFLAVGFVGAYTTFSSLTVETLTLVQQGSVWRGVLNFFANNLVGFLCAVLGNYLARFLTG